MYRKELTSNMVSYLRDNGMKKRIIIPKSRFLISDDDGNQKYFYIRGSDRMIAYTVDDVDNMLEAFTEVVLRAISNGEKVSLKNLGSFEVWYRKPRRTKSIVSGQWVEVPGRYLPRFSFSNGPKQCAASYGNGLENMIDPNELEGDFDGT